MNQRTIVNVPAACYEPVEAAVVVAVAAAAVGAAYPERNYSSYGT